MLQEDTVYAVTGFQMPQYLGYRVRLNRGEPYRTSHDITRHREKPQPPLVAQSPDPHPNRVARHHVSLGHAGATCLTVRHNIQMAMITLETARTGITCLTTKPKCQTAKRRTTCLTAERHVTMAVLDKRA